MNNLGQSDRVFAEQNFSNFVDNPLCGSDSNISDTSSFTEDLGLYDEMYSDSDFDTTEYNREAGLSALGLTANFGSSTSCYSCGGRMPMTPYSNFGSLCPTCAKKKASNYTASGSDEKKDPLWKTISYKIGINPATAIVIFIIIILFLLMIKNRKKSKS